MDDEGHDDDDDDDEEEEDDDEDDDEKEASSGNWNLMSMDEDEDDVDDDDDDDEEEDESTGDGDIIVVVSESERGAGVGACCEPLVLVLVLAVVASKSASDSPVVAGELKSTTRLSASAASLSPLAFVTNETWPGRMCSRMTCGKQERTSCRSTALSLAAAMSDGSTLSMWRMLITGSAVGLLLLLLLLTDDDDDDEDALFQLKLNLRRMYFSSSSPNRLTRRRGRLSYKNESM